MEHKFPFDREEVYEVTVLPVTRSMLIRADPNMEDPLFPLKTNLTESMDSLKCQKNGALVDIKNHTMLCDFVKPPTITLTVNQAPVEEGIKAKEGTNLTLGCKAVGGVPDEVDGFIWMIRNEALNDATQFMDYQIDYSHNSSMEHGTEILCREKTDRTLTCNAVNGKPHKVEGHTSKIDKSEEKKASHLNYMLDIGDDKKFISCIVNNQAFGGAFYNSSFIIPQKVGDSYN